MSTWRAEAPELWDAVTEGYGEGWWDRTLEEIVEFEAQRAVHDKCAFCGAELTAEAVVAVPPVPYLGPFCNEGHAGLHLWFYCMREGK